MPVRNRDDAILLPNLLLLANESVRMRSCNKKWHAVTLGWRLDKSIVQASCVFLFVVDWILESERIYDLLSKFTRYTRGGCFTETNTFWLNVWRENPKLYQIELQFCQNLFIPNFKGSIGKCKFWKFDFPSFEFLRFFLKYKQIPTPKI